MTRTENGVRTRRSTRARPTDDDLLDAALVVFAEHGFAATTMSAVAARCDSTKPTLYAHFGEKDALFERLLTRESERCKAALFTAYAEGAGLELREQVAVDTRALFDYAAEHGDGFALLLGGDPTTVAVRVREQLLAEVNDHLAHRVHDYLVTRGAASSTEGPTRLERQVAAMLAGVAQSAARHALTSGERLDEACEMAIAFSVAALAHLDPSG